jgi:hypothetical protein
MIKMRFRNDPSNLDSPVVKTKHLCVVKRIVGKSCDILSTPLGANQPVHALPRETMSLTQIRPLVVAVFLGLMVTTAQAGDAT